MALMDIVNLDRDVDTSPNAAAGHDPRWLRSPSSNLISGPSNRVIALIQSPPDFVYATQKVNEGLNRYQNLMPPLVHRTVDSPEGRAQFEIAPQPPLDLP